MTRWSKIGIAVMIVGAVWIGVLVARPSEESVMPTVAGLDEAAQARAAAAATTSPAVQALTGNRPVRLVQVFSSGIGAQYQFAQVALELVDGPATLTGEWPRAVIENPARCETCKPDGPLRWHYVAPRETHAVTGLLVNVDLDTSAVKEILPSPDPLTPATAPPRPAAWGSSPRREPEPGDGLRASS